MQTDDPRPAGHGANFEGIPAARVEPWSAVAVLAALAFACSAPLLQDGWFVSHEDIRPIARALAAYHEIAAGDPYPRWITAAYGGKGAPLFDFYPPAFSFLVAYAHAAGAPLLLAAKAILVFLFFAGSLGVYLWVRPHLGHVPALVAAILYMFAPYHFVDLYVRGATAEFASLAALPFLFRAIDMLLERPSAGGLASLAFAFAAIVLSHFAGALMIAPFAAVYALARIGPAGRAPAALGRLVAGVALGASLSAFYWLPALVDRDALSPERLRGVFAGYYSPFVHFVYPEQWLDPSWGFGTSVAGPRDGMSFQIGVVLLASVAASALLVRFLGRDRRRFVLLVLVLGAAAVALTSAVAGPLYEWPSPLRTVQFPWRFLGPATLLLSASGAGFASLLAERRLWFGQASVAALAAVSVAASVPQRAVEARLAVPDDAAAIEAAVVADPWSAKFGNEDEYLPREATIEAAGKTVGPGPWGLGVEIASVRTGSAEATIDVTSPEGRGVVVVPWHAFPGWKVSIDGRASQLTPGPDGLVAFAVPQGRHVARVHFGTTAPRVAGWILALAAIATLGAAGLRGRALTRAGRPGAPPPPLASPRA